MNRHCRDVRVWLPCVVAAVCFAWRECTVAVAVPLPSAARAIELPELHGLPPATQAQAFELDAGKSSVRFLVEGSGGELLVQCTGISGRLDLAAGGRSGELDLRFDLNSLQTIAGGAGTIDVPHVLAVPRDSEVVYRARLVARTTSGLPGVEQLTWLGPLQLGTRVQQQAMVLWQCSLPGRPLRLQGHGPVPTANYGLPRRWWLGLFEEQYLVTLGLDLAWRRARGR